jgi:hypothetical protein
MKRIIIAIFFITIVSQSNACPFCGCGGGNLYMGLMPDFSKGFVGIRYHYSQYHTTLVSDPSQFSNNYYNIIEAYGGVSIGKHLQVLAFVPYYQNKQVDDDGKTTPHGLGDATVLAQYKVFSSTHLTAGKKVVQQQLWLGAGVKLPTGSFDVDVNDPELTVADINAQLGTGSTDVLLNATYSARVENFGVNASANYKLNTKNSDGYKYGNKFTGNLIGYYRFGAKNTGVSPNAGLMYENIAGNLLKASKVQYTSSNVTNAILGVEFNFNKIGVGVNGQLPVIQNFAEGQTKLKFKAMAHITFSI